MRLPEIPLLSLGNAGGHAVTLAPVSAWANRAFFPLKPAARILPGVGAPAMGGGGAYHCGGAPLRRRRRRSANHVGDGRAPAADTVAPGADPVPHDLSGLAFVGGLHELVR